MIYLDYSASTPVNDSVLDTFIKVNKEYIGNGNSIHKLGMDINHLVEASTEQIKDLLHLKDREVVYTSGSSEANNLAIKGIALKYSNRGKHIITSKLEHSSIYEPLKYLESQGFKVSYVKLDSNGLIDLEDLKRLIDNETILVSINAINSELGLREPIEGIASIVSNYPKCFFHVDATQAIGKVNINLSKADLISFSSHKIYGIKGIGALIKKKEIELIPLIHGGKSVSIYRSGTPSHPLIASFSKSLRLSLENIDEKYKYIDRLNKIIKDRLSSYKDVYINSNDYCIPHILNVSIIGVKPETFVHALEEYDIYISTRSACSEENSYSKPVLEFTSDLEKAKSSIRISLSHLTKEEDINIFLDVFEKCYKELKVS